MSFFYFWGNLWGGRAGKLSTKSEFTLALETPFYLDLVSHNWDISNWSISDVHLPSLPLVWRYLKFISKSAQAFLSFLQDQNGTWEEPKEPSQS